MKIRDGGGRCGRKHRQSGGQRNVMNGFTTALGWRRAFPFLRGRVERLRYTQTCGIACAAYDLQRWTGSRITGINGRHFLLC